MNITEIQMSRDFHDASGLIKLGEISYINCEIFNYPLNKIIQSQYLKDESTETKEDDFKIEINTGVPNDLNKLFEEGLIDAAPISSFAYLKRKKHYKLLKRISISAFGKVKSVLFFSNQSFKELKSLQENGLKPKINVSEESASSVGLLKILLAEKYNLDLKNIEFIKFSGRGEGLPNKLLIGDKALLEANPIPEDIHAASYQYIYDLGEEWFDLSNGLPMVFGVWAHKLNPKKEEFLQSLIIRAKTMGLNENLDEIIDISHSKTNLQKNILSNYFQTLNYDFTDEHIQGLALYESYLNKWSLI
ncbi:MAG: menaquinone biosynthesis protein [Candidatus Melainabacteria bacterium]|nr:menaquinone biosynthesis protein [Candidatus Melainabacteria bacterium]